jgi:hypothetical protein
MKENFPTPANTSGSAAPIPQDTPEITRQDIDSAGFEDVSVALDNYRVLLSNQLVATSSPAVQKSLEQVLHQAELTDELSIKWLDSNTKRSEDLQGHETFKEFLARNEAEETHPAVLERISSVTNLVLSRVYDNYVGEAILARRQKEAVDVAPTGTGPEQEQDTQFDISEELGRQAEQRRTFEESARKNVEQARGVEVFDNVVQLAKNRTYLKTDLHGYTYLGDVKRIGTDREVIPKSIRQEAEANPDFRQHLNEAVMFTDLTEPQTRTVTKEREVKGRFGRSKPEEYTVNETIPNSDHQVMIKNEETGQDEPAVRFRYNFGYSLPAISAGELPSYQEFQGSRAGQTIQVSVDLPKSVANRLQEQIEQDPASARELAEKLFLQNNDGQLTEEYWRKGGAVGHPIRPPYEKLPEDWNIAIVTGAESTKGTSKDFDHVLSHQVQRIRVHQ